VGGLLALFLGASVVTVVELCDLALCRHRACARPEDRKRKSRDRKPAAENASNHEMFGEHQHRWHIRPASTLEYGPAGVSVLKSKLKWRHQDAAVAVASPARGTRGLTGCRPPKTRRTT